MAGNSRTVDGVTIADNSEWLELCRELNQRPVRD
jgi:hypothetical protein